MIRRAVVYVGVVLVALVALAIFAAMVFGLLAVAPSEALKITATAFLAVVVFIVGQIFLKLVIEPVLALRGIIGEIEAAVTMYAPEYGNPPVRRQDGTIFEADEERRVEARVKVRELASKLSGAGYTVAWGYGLAERLGLIPSRVELRQARRALIGLSNSMFPRLDNLRDARGYVAEIRAALHLPPED